MSASGGIEPGAAHGLPVAYLRDNAATYLAILTRKPRAVLWSRGELVSGIAVTAGAIAFIVLTMFGLDAWSVVLAEGLPRGLIAIFDDITDYGRSGWFLVPIGLMLLLVAALCRPSLSAMSQRVFAALAVRLGFLFAAILLPGLTFTIVKRLIGRARPLVGGTLDPFLYRPLHWDVEYASLPSGHAVNAFAAATALGLLWPRMRPVLWIYAVAIGISRVVLTAHYPSDVLAGAMIGIAGTLLIRNWFAARRLGFVPASDGGVRPMRGPSLARLRRVARELIAP